MASTTLTGPRRPVENAFASGRLASWAPWTVLAGAFVVSAAFVGLVNAAAGGGLADYNVTAALVLGALLYMGAIVSLSALVEGGRKARDRLVTALVSTAFLVALTPLVSLLWQVVSSGIHRFDLQFFTYSMRNVVGEGGGAIHAIWGTILVTLAATLVSVPIGLLTSVYLVEYGKNGSRLAKAITFLVDVMTGIPSIVAGLFAYALFALFLGPAASGGFMGAAALTVLMIPVVVRSSEEMLRLVPNELREASYALGVPKWLTIVKVVLPTSIAGITTGVMLAIARVIGETAPLLLTAGFTADLNVNLFDGNMMTLPVFVYSQYSNPGTTPDAALNRAWAAALTLILIVMLLNLVGRLVARYFAPKYGRR